MNGSSRKHQQIFAMPPNTRFQPTRSARCACSTCNSTAGRQAGTLIAQDFVVWYKQEVEE
jgi:hypothetical protein